MAATTTDTLPAVPPADLSEELEAADAIRRNVAEATAALADLDAARPALLVDSFAGAEGKKRLDAADRRAGDLRARIEGGSAALAELRRRAAAKLARHRDALLAALVAQCEAIEGEYADGLARITDDPRAGAVLVDRVALLRRQHLSLSTELHAVTGEKRFDMAFKTRLPAALEAHRGRSPWLPFPMQGGPVDFPRPWADTLAAFRALDDPERAAQERFPE